MNDKLNYLCIQSGMKTTSDAGLANRAAAYKLIKPGASIYGIHHRNRAEL